jgi:hypothetical protein
MSDRNNNPPTNTAVLIEAGYEFKPIEHIPPVYIDTGRGWRKKEADLVDRTEETVAHDLPPGVGGDQVAPSADVDEVATTPGPSEG